MRKRFKISPSPGENFFWAYVFDTHREMHKWYSRYLSKNYILAGSNYSVNEDQSDFSAMVMPYQRVSIEGENEVPQRDIGIVILNREALGIGVIAHEMTHCALWHDRLINGNHNAEYGLHSCESEERLAYLIGDYTRCFVDKAYKLNLFA